MQNLIYEEEQSALIFQLCLNCFLVLCILVYVYCTQDWSKNTDEDLSGQEIKDNINKSSGFNPEMSALCQPKEDSISEPLLSKGSETIDQTLPFRFGKILGHTGGEISVI